MATDRLCLLTCTALAPEIRAALSAEGFNEVALHTFPVQCLRPQSAQPVLLSRLGELEEGYDRIEVLGGGCLAGARLPEGLKGITALHRSDTCFQLLLNKTLVDHYLEDGAYLLTPGWLSHWRRHLEAWGFDSPTAREFFGESATRLLLLDTGLYEQKERQLKAFAEHVGLPWERLPIGLEHLRCYLARHLMGGRPGGPAMMETAEPGASPRRSPARPSEGEQGSKARFSETQRRLADFAILPELATELTIAETEEEALRKILEQFNMICAPKQMNYLVVKEGAPGAVYAVPDNGENPEAARRRLAGLDEQYRYTESGEGFVIAFRHDGERVGVMELEGLLFPEHRAHYLNLAVTVGGLFGMALAQKRANQELAHAEARLQQAQKLESLSMMAGGIAHEFNNILMIILGNAAFGLDDLPPHSPVREIILNIERAAKRAARLVKPMHLFTGNWPLRGEPLDLNQRVLETVRILEAAITGEGKIKYDFTGELPPITADGNQLHQIITNLLTNASEAMEGREGVIHLNTGVMTCDGAYLRQAVLGGERPEGRYVYVEVADQGCGMEEGILKKIFDPFFTTKFIGRGLGLATVLGTMRGHHGAIRVHSTPGKGTTFRVLFPADEALPGPGTPNP